MLHYQLNCRAGVRRTDGVWRLCGTSTGPRVLRGAWSSVLPVTRVRTDLRSWYSPGPDQALVHQVVPGAFGHVHVEVGGGAADVLEGDGAVGVGDVLDLIETGQGGADVAG